MGWDACPEDRETAEAAVEDAIRILTDAGRRQPWLSPSCKSAVEAHQRWLSEQKGVAGG